MLKFNPHKRIFFYSCETVKDGQRKDLKVVKDSRALSQIAS